MRSTGGLRYLEISENLSPMKSERMNLGPSWDQIFGADEGTGTPY